MKTIWPVDYGDYYMIGIDLSCLVYDERITKDTTMHGRYCSHCKVIHEWFRSRCSNCDGVFFLLGEHDYICESCSDWPRDKTAWELGRARL